MRHSIYPHFAGMIGLEGNEISNFLPSAGEKLEDMKDQLRKRIFKKRKVRTLAFSIADGLTIQVNTYALIRPTIPGAIMWLDSVTNLPLQADRSLICVDTGALIEEPLKLFHPYKKEKVLFSRDQISEIKKVSNSDLRLLGFKPLDCLKDYHNLRPSTFIFPSDEDELINSSGRIEPPGLHMIYLPYCDDIRHIEEIHATVDATAPRATHDQIDDPSALIKRIDLKGFSVLQFANPALQRHYGILQALALDEDEMPDIKDETVPDEEGLARPAVVRSLTEFKRAVYGENHDQEEADLMAARASGSEASRKRQKLSEAAVRESSNFDWNDLAESGKLKDLTVVELKFYLTAHNLPVTGKKEALIRRILTHLGK